MRTQLHAGYVLSSVKKSLTHFPSPIHLEDLLAPLATFDIDYQFAEAPDADSVPVILDNQLSRGLPTFPSIFIEEQFADNLGFTVKKINGKLGEINYEPTDLFDDQIETLYNSFFIVEPRLKTLFASHKFSYTDQPLDSQPEDLFMNALLPGRFHESLVQLVEPQRTIPNIIQYANYSEDPSERSRILFNMPITVRIPARTSHLFQRMNLIDSGLIFLLSSRLQEIWPQLWLLKLMALNIRV